MVIFNNASEVPVPSIVNVESFWGSIFVQGGVLRAGALKSSETITSGLFKNSRWACHS